MDANTVTTLIGSLGFPIVACGFMGWYIVTTQKELIQVMNQVAKTLKGITTLLDMEDEEDE